MPHTKQRAVTMPAPKRHTEPMPETESTVVFTIEGESYVLRVGAERVIEGPRRSQPAEVLPMLERREW